MKYVTLPHTYRNTLLDGSWDSTAVLSQAYTEIDKAAGELPYI